MPSTNNAASRVFVSLVLGGLARAHRAAAAFGHYHPGVAIDVELTNDHDELSAADPANLPDLLIILDGNVLVRLPAGSVEHTIVDALKREWATTLASTGGGRRMTTNLAGTTEDRVRRWIAERRLRTMRVNGQDVVRLDLVAGLAAGPPRVSDPLSYEIASAPPRGASP